MLLKSRSSGNHLMSKIVVVEYQYVEMNGIVISTVSEK